MDWLVLIPIMTKITEKLMDKIPDYDDRQRKKYLKLKERYEKEDVKNFPERDDNLVCTYRDDLLRFLDSFAKKI